MKALLLALATTLPCDWVKTESVNPMTDAKVCMVRSPSAEIAFVVNGSDRPDVITVSAYHRPSIYVRVDDNEAVRRGRDVTGFLDALLPQIQTGTRIRTRVQDYPTWRDGDAAICNLPELLASCGAP